MTSGAPFLIIMCSGADTFPVVREWKRLALHKSLWSYARPGTTVSGDA